jgi:integrase
MVIGATVGAAWVLGHRAEMLPFWPVWVFVAVFAVGVLFVASAARAEIDPGHVAELRAVTGRLLDVANGGDSEPYRSAQRIDRALYLTATMTGLRQGELIALRWRDVDWTAGRVRVRQNYVLGEFGTPKSRRSTRSVPMADSLAVELRHLHRASNWTADDDLVFADPDTGGPLDKAAIRRRYRRALKAANLDESHRFHDLRHTFGTRMAGAGTPMRTLQEWMGHRDIETTQRYADYAPSPHEVVFVEVAFGGIGVNPPPTEQL